MKTSERVMSEASKKFDKRKEPSIGELDYQKELSIDKFALDGECMDQPRRYFTYASLWSDAVRERDKAKQDLKIAKAKAVAEIKNNPSVVGLDKWTDVAGGIAIENHPEVVRTVDALIEAERKEGILFAAVEAFRDRKGMLTSLVQLYLSGYWSDVKLPKESSDSLGKEEGARQRDHFRKMGANPK